MAKQFLTPYPLNANAAVGVIVGATANTSSAGGGTIGTDIMLVFTAGANDSFLESVRFSPVSSVAATATTATVLRLFLSSQSSGATTAANTTLIAEVSAAAQTAAHSTAATFFFEVLLNKKIPTGKTILATSHVVNAANTSWVAVPWGMDY